MPNQPTAAQDAPDPQATAQTRARLIKKFGQDGDLLSLGTAIARVLELTSSPDEAAQSITYYVLADAALTQKILRLANTVTYRGAANTPITTISRAIFVLGLDTVRTAALALLLVDSLNNPQHVEAIRRELVESLAASLLGRELSRQNQIQGAEEASIAALFSNLGRMLVASHEHELYRRVQAFIQAGTAPAQSAIRVLGCSYEFLSANVLKEWNFSDTLSLALEKPAAGVLKPPATRLETLRTVVAFCSDAAHLVMRPPGSIGPLELQPLLTRYGTALQIDAERLEQLLSLVGREIESVMASLNLMPGVATAAPAPARPNTLPGVLKLSALTNHTINTDERYDSGKPLNARDRLLDGVQLATQIMGTGKFKPSALTLHVVETLFVSLGLRFATVCLRDSRSGRYQSVVSIGEKQAERHARFGFPFLAAGDNIFHLAMENSADLMIEDAAMGRIRELVPEWHKTLLPDARSVIVLPLVQNGQPLGLFYGDRTKPAPEGISSDEAALIKTLVGQMQAALANRPAAA